MSTTTTASAPAAAQPAPELIELIELLATHQRELALDDAKFCRSYLTFSATVWRRMITGEYWSMIKDHEKVLRVLRADLRTIEKSRIADGRTTAEFYRHPDAVLVLDAITEARSKPLSDPDRLIVYLAPTGGGKSAIALHLRREGARTVEARESWQRSYFCACRDIASACSIDPDNFSTPGQIEDALIQRLSSRRLTLVIDEGEFFGSRTLNLIKLLLNKTPVVILLCVIPGAYDLWTRKNWHEATQLRRRTHALIKLGIDTKSAAAFFRGCDLEPKALDTAAFFARTFGAFDTLRQIRDELPETGRITPADIVNLANRIRLRQGLHPLATSH